MVYTRTALQLYNFKPAGSLLFLFGLLFQTCDSVSASNAFLMTANINCACPGEEVTFTCTAVGGGITVWSGTAFDCSSGMNDISLSHTRFMEGISKSCNGGAIVARSVGVTDNRYTSQLSVQVSSDLNSRTIQCAHDSTAGPTTTVGTSTLVVVNTPEAPTIQSIDFSDGHVVLTLAPPPSTCASVYYRVISNCSTCTSGTTNSTIASCPIPQQWTDRVVCAFSARSEVCGGNLTGTSESSVLVTFQEPTVNIVPIYSEENTLIRVIAHGINLGFAESDSTTIYVTEYNVTFLNPDTNTVTYSAPYSTCQRDTCNATDITPLYLSQICLSSTITVTVRADYGLGERLLSNPIDIGCTNRFIDVQYNQADSTISCVFLNPTNTSIKSCRVTYGPCGQEQTQTVGNSSTELSSNITLMIPHGSYCYTVTASSDAFTIAVEGTIISDSSEDADKSNVGAIIGGVVGGILFIIVLVVVPIVVIVRIVLKLRHQKGKPNGSVRMLSIMPSIEDKLKLELITNRKFEKLEVEKNGKLREAVESSNKTFKRGRTFYEFINDVESISEDKNLIFMNKDTGKYFSPTVSVDVLYKNNLLGEGVQNPWYKRYRVFVQSTGSGARYLQAETSLLYEQVQSNPWNPDNAPLQQVISNHFTITTITSSCTAEDFQRKYDLRANAPNVFVECTNPTKKDFRDVMLMDKKSGKLFTGPTARSDPSAYLDKYRVFVLHDTEKLKLQSGQTVLYQNPESRRNLQFHVLEVEEDIQMAKFVEKKLRVKFENGRAFYEFTHQSEDLLFYRDIVVKRKTSDISEMQDGIEFKSSILRFYWLSRSVPGIGIEPPTLDYYQVFVQSTSQGSRCLKAKTQLLYKI